MLLTFTFENFKSFAECARLSMEAHKADKTMIASLIDSPRKVKSAGKVLPAAAIYGANAAGKTNLLLALGYMQEAVRHSHASWTPESGTRVTPHAGNTDRPCRMEVEISVGNTVYKYGFEAYQKYFSSEWLYSYPKGRERLLFERNTSKDGDNFQTRVTFGKHLSGDQRDNESISRRTRENSLFISAGSQENQHDCRIVLDWFARVLQIRHSAEPRELYSALSSRMCVELERFKPLVLELLRASDPGIDDIIISKNSPGKSKLSSTITDEDIELFVEETRNYSVSFVIATQNGPMTLPFDVQSNGIKRLYADAAFILLALRGGAILVIDELETSMHPHMAAYILALFQTRFVNRSGSQLIFSTHETRLLNLSHLRRDQVWFVEKRGGSSELYSLLEFSPRKDENFEQGYLRGRYGAIPPAKAISSWVELLHGDIDEKLNSDV